MPVDYHKELKKKLSASYERQVKQWMASDPAQLIAAAEDIAAIRFIHDRMPVLVAEADARAWLDPANTLEQLLPCALDRVEWQEEPAQRGGDPEE